MYCEFIKNKNYTDRLFLFILMNFMLAGVTRTIATPDRRPVNTGHSFYCGTRIIPVSESLGSTLRHGA